MKNIIVILGTRPEAIKLAPVILELRNRKNACVYVCNTEQQKELSNQTLGFFGIHPDCCLDVMRPNQTLAGVGARMLDALSDVYTWHKFDATIVQGDTMSVFCGALVSFYNKIPVFHVEAGLRSHDIYEPFPEEALRQMVSRITHTHFAPTVCARDALVGEGIAPEHIIVTGNTVIDALGCLSPETLGNARKNLDTHGVNLNDRLVLVTVHRRENHGTRLDKILQAIRTLAREFENHQFVLPVHPNPNVRDKVYDALGNVRNVILTPPLDYPELVCIMKHAKLVMTDSGGIQEEAPTFGTPVLVMRYETERREGVDAGFARLVGADPDKILGAARVVLSRTKSETMINGRKNPYGDGHAAEKIANAIMGQQS